MIVEEAGGEVEREEEGWGQPHLAPFANRVVEGERGEPTSISIASSCSSVSKMEDSFVLIDLGRFAPPVEPTPNMPRPIPIPDNAVPAGFGDELGVGSESFEDSVDSVLAVELGLRFSSPPAATPDTLEAHPWEEVSTAWGPLIEVDLRCFWKAF